MSRDPEDHSPVNPNELHKYLYAGGDPVNAADPTGKGLVDWALTNVIRNPVVIGVTVIAGAQCTAIWILNKSGAERYGNSEVKGVAEQVEDVYCGLVIGVASAIVGFGNPPFGK